MTNIKIFIAGARAITGLDPQIEHRLSVICRKGYAVLIGDASGVDTAIQKYFLRAGYRNVIVYASNGKARNNAGNWPVQAVPARGRVSGFDFYAAKDKAMAADADYGFMIWNGESKGTLNNITNLLNYGKKALVYFDPMSEFVSIDSFEKLGALIRNCPDSTKTLFRTLRRGASAA